MTFPNCGKEMGYNCYKTICYQFYFLPTFEYINRTLTIPNSVQHTATHTHTQLKWRKTNFVQYPRLSRAFTVSEMSCSLARIAIGIRNATHLNPITVHRNVSIPISLHELAATVSVEKGRRRTIRMEWTEKRSFTFCSLFCLPQKSHNPFGWRISG